MPPEDDKRRSSDRDIREVRKEEVSRGRRPVKFEKGKQQNFYEGEFAKVIRNGSTGDFIALLDKLGFHKDHEKYPELMKLWNEHVASKNSGVD
jgi:hypothetical protein